MNKTPRLGWWLAETYLWLWGLPYDLATKAKRYLRK